MTEPAAPTPQIPAEDRVMKGHEEAVEKAWGALTEAILEFGQARHVHHTITQEAHKYTNEQIFAAAQRHRQAEADAKAALEAVVGAQQGMLREIDKRTSPQGGPAS